MKPLPWKRISMFLTATCNAARPVKADVSSVTCFRACSTIYLQEQRAFANTTAVALCKIVHTRADCTFWSVQFYCTCTCTQGYATGYNSCYVDKVVSIGTLTLIFVLVQFEPAFRITNTTAQFISICFNCTLTIFAAFSNTSLTIETQKILLVTAVAICIAFEYNLIFVCLDTCDILLIWHKVVCANTSSSVH